MSVREREEEEAAAQRILRITDIAQEPLEFLAPIRGYGQMPLVPLEIAIEPLVPILPDVESYAYVAKQRCKNPVDGLSQDESASIMLYTMGWKPFNECLYVVLNATLRSKDRERLEPWLLYLRLLFGALFRLPSLSGVVYRGVKLDMSKEYTVGKTIVWWGFSSCTTAVGVLQSELFLGTIGTRTMFTIHCESAKDIRKHSYYSAEDEVLLPGATQFKVISCLKQGDLHIIQLEETRPPHPLLQPILVVPHPSNPSSTVMPDDNPQTRTSTQLPALCLVKADPTSKEMFPQTITTIESERDHPIIRVPTKMFLNQRRSSDAICLKKDAIVYVPDVSSDLPENDVKQLIQTRVETTQRMKVNDVKFYSKLGIAVIRLMNEDDKKHLVSNVQSMILDTQRHTSVSFTAELDLDSYIVLDRNMPKIPSHNEVARHYAQACETQELRACESISIQFPNIFRIHLTTLDELIKAVNISGFKIENTSATVYPRADCSFFEDLPQNTNDDKLSSAIAAQIGESHLPLASLYVQYNKQTGAAVVLAVKSVQKWMMEGHLIIDRRNISKKTRLAYRVLVSPVPCGFDLNRILNHKLFAHRVVSHKHIGNNFIIELDNIDTYNDCLKIEDLGLDNNPMTIKPHTVCNDPDNSELDAMNWYETAMLDIKPDIMTIINNHQHPIFRYKWNAENWNQQMKKAREMDRHSTKYDLNRHLLRVTVMLNTIAVLRKKKYVVDGEEVILNLERMRTIGYDHQAKLLNGKIIHQTELKTPYPSTTVKVVNEDCLVLYEKLVYKGYQPLLLNMANARIPGGNYRKGDGGQEENLFRRSDYYQSLDLEIADKERSERLYCTSKCELKRVKGFASFYPMEEFGAIYTSGITVFRQTEANGYAYMKKPLYNVCAIAMAAYREPYLNNKNMLENKPAINTHRKIKNIFAIAHQHKHDCLVLSAFGCGALRNPPEHIALLFKSVIYQYAGYFKKIYFAIIGDYNTGNQINPDGNFLLFKKIFDGLVVEPPKTLRVNEVSGPYRILNKLSDGQLTLSDACILYLPPCQYGSQCRDLENPQHTNQYSHPPMCPLQDATSSCSQTNDEVHMFTFIHSMKRKYGNKCKNRNRAHLNKYDHSERYMNASYCESNAERMSSIEPSMEAKKKSLCSGIKNGKPDSSLKDDVSSTSNSSMLSSVTMLSTARTPCRDSVYCLQQDVLDHTRKYSHPCRFNELCQNKINEPHLVHERHNIPTCSQDKSCSEKANPVHRAKYRHTQLPDYLVPCRYQNKCFDTSVSHRIKYFHGEVLPLNDKSKQTAYDYSGEFDES